ncbi:hypothetical protein GJ744_008047 [Endocarpon pusillum]|uniref:Rhodopsin domain-containing protein n=1 Tax=Endocarpon pusillum TaxID=364733 RepID=A0A8H7E3T1_9EURO|nr:hypothetical protein GJ744_008047 [Endocarpon pusillum]
MDLSTLPRDTPALKPPPGTTSNFDNPYNIKPEIYATVGVCLGVSTVLVWLRAYTKFVILKSHGWEDYYSFIAWAGLVAYAVLGLIASSYGSGVHQWDVRIHNFVTWAKLANVMEIYYNPLIFITKLSILLQYIKIFAPSRTGKTYWSVHFLIWINLLFYIAVMLVQIMQCLPRAKIWNPTIPGRCVDIANVLIVGAIINVVSDVSILVLPIHKVWHLQMPRNRKIGVSAVFMAGLFACISSIVRMVGNVQFARTEDLTFALTPVALWTFAEVTSGILCGCLPVLPQFFRFYVPKWRQTLHLSPGNTSPGGSKTSYACRMAALKDHKTHVQDAPGADGRYIELNNHKPPTDIRE